MPVSVGSLAKHHDRVTHALRYPRSDSGRLTDPIGLGRGMRGSAGFAEGVARFLMTIRTVNYAISPQAARPVSISQATSLQFDVSDVIAPAIREILSSAAGLVSLQSMIEDLLVPTSAAATPLIWLEGGVGVGTEMKRGFSGILGRFFARWYLETYHQLAHFVPIDGEGVVLSRDLVIRRTGKVHLPDWICTDPAGRPVLAEAKGSHNQTNWPSPASATPLQKARDQLSSAVVQKRSSAGILRRVTTKGWAVMSRWGTVQNGRPPLLYILDPVTPGEEMTETEALSTVLDIQRAALSMYMQKLGHPGLAKRLSYQTSIDVTRLQQESDKAEGRFDYGPSVAFRLAISEPDTLFSPSITRSINLESIGVDDEQLVGRRFVGGIIDLTGRLIADNVSDLLRSRQSGPSELFGGLYFAGFDTSVLTDSIEGGQTSTLKPIRLRRGSSSAAFPEVTVLSDGFAFLPIEAISDVRPVSGILAGTLI